MKNLIRFIDTATDGQNVDLFVVINEGFVLTYGDKLKLEEAIKRHKPNEIWEDVEFIDDAIKEVFGENCKYEVLVPDFNINI